ncbi:type VII secretion integral membrane protein EccD [Streptomyces sp. So13.3]|uniref:type VII secretion integral membrane protein EccD n=1 Tax=unclassified Streptomyces TaxID=2593676 RepID=UPI001106EE48|nr:MULTISPECIES: type VII secretion integral membrane protein EccD [unclassified Streptomyces]MCZ4100256.1 type VII secretion integral membrane protein EccD [Streptomyces sp. H39-C1]QNA75695.1 type VII secretion integral membrane protein EccD [Streptomyces sp. So13.3]
MITTAATGYCRVTVVAPDSRIDLALPDDVPVADLRSELLTLSGQTQVAGEPTGFHLTRRDGSVLDGGLSLAAQRVLDGELLSLRPFADSLPPAVHDDVVDAIASAVDRDRHSWSDDLMRAAGLSGGVVLLLMTGFVLWFADPLRHDMHSLPGVIAGASGVLLTALAGVRARVYDDRASAVALGLGGLPMLLIAGSGIIEPRSGEGPGRLQFLVGCVTVLIAAILLIALLPYGDAPFVGAAMAAAAGTLTTFGTIMTGAAPREAAAVAGVTAVALVGFLPGWSARFARLPIGFRSPQESAGPGRPVERFGERPTTEPVDYGPIAAQARRGHEMLLGLVGGCSAVVLGSAAVLGFSDSVWAQLLALAVGVATLLRARLFRYTAQVVCLLVAGIGAVTLLILGLALNPPAGVVRELLQGDRGPLDVRTIWLSAAVAMGAALLTAIALIVPRQGVSPFWGRTLDLAEGFILLALVPLCLAVLDVYTSVRSLTSG